MQLCPVVNSPAWLAVVLRLACVAVVGRVGGLAGLNPSLRSGGIGIRGLHFACQYYGISSCFLLFYLLFFLAFFGFFSYF